MIKKVNPTTIALALELLMLKADSEVEAEFNKWPDDPDGVEVSWEDFKNHYDMLSLTLRKSVEALLGKTLPEVEEPESPEEPAPTTVVEEGVYWGRHNGDRPMWYFSKPMKDYPQKFTVVIDGCTTVDVDGHNGTRFVERYTIVKQSSVRGRGMAVITGAHCKSKSCHIVLGG